MGKKLHSLAAFLLMSVLATVLIVPTSTAQAVNGGIDPPPAGGFRPVILSDTGFVPKPPFSMEVGSCGVLVGISLDNQRLMRTITYRNGDVKTIYSGRETIWINDEDYPDQVNGNPVTFTVRGKVTKVAYASGARYEKRDAPAMLVVSSTSWIPTAEGAALERARLPLLALLKAGSLTTYTPANATKAKLLSVPKRYEGVCSAMGLGQYYNGSRVYDVSNN